MNGRTIPYRDPDRHTKTGEEQQRGSISCLLAKRNRFEGNKKKKGGKSIAAGRKENAAQNHKPGNSKRGSVLTERRNRKNAERRKQRKRDRPEERDLVKNNRVQGDLHLREVEGI